MKRRTFLKGAGIVAGGLAASSSTSHFTNGQAKAAEEMGKVWVDTPDQEKPNILIIMVDQLRFPQGLFTQEIMDEVAPNLKWLRENSVSFDSHFAAAAMCTPSRSTMLTGLYTHQNGIFLTDAGSGFPRAPDLDPGFPTWGSILNSSDFQYNTYWWGKWHLSSNDATDPGYAQQYGFVDGGLPCPAPNTGLGRGLGVDPLSVEAFQNWLDAYTQSDAAAAPWCTTVSLTNPHDIAWYPSCTFGRDDIAALATDPQPGEEDPPDIFTALPSNFEVWPDALTDQNKPSLQAWFVAVTDLQGGEMPANPQTDEDKKLWYQLLDLYVQVTSYVDRQIGAVLDTINDEDNYPGLMDNTIIVFTADHGEYGGAHGLRNKGFAVYEESIHVPLYVYDPTETFIPAHQSGTTRTQFTSHVDLLPLLMTLASGNNEWRTKTEYAHLAGRADLFAMLGDRFAEGRDYIITTSDEDYPELLAMLGRSGKIPQGVVDKLNDIINDFGGRPPNHVIGYRTSNAKLGVYSNFAPGTIDIELQGQESELYNYLADGIDEVINHAPGSPDPDQALYVLLREALFDPDTGAVATELRQPLPTSLQAVQQRAIDRYVAFQEENQLPPSSTPPPSSRHYIPSIHR